MQAKLKKLNLIVFAYWDDLNCAVFPGNVAGPDALQKVVEKPGWMGAKAQ